MTKLVMLVAIGSLCAVTVSCNRRKKIDDDTLQVAVGARHACALMSDKTVRCWGDNDQGQLGDGTHESRALPVKLPPTETKFIDIEAGGTLTCARTEERTVRCWGGVRRTTSSGALTTGSEPVPIDVSSLKDVEQVAIGGGHGCARLETGTVRCFGLNDRGQLGAGHTDRATGAVEVSGLWGVTWIAAGREHSCAVLTDGTARCWGRNNEGQLGDGTTKDSASPVSVTQILGVKRIACGGAHTCAVLSDGSVKCWGKNDQGQLGDGTKVRHPTPSAVLNLEGQRGVAAGDAHTCAWGGDATIQCWGANDQSQMADGTKDARVAPHRIVGFSGQSISAVPEMAVGIEAVKLGDGFTCVRPGDRHIRCWGRNDRGQAGDGTQDVRPVPVAVKLARATSE